MKTKIISAFPACGKTHYFQNNKDKVCLDSDSSDFSWIKDKDGNNTKERNPDFPKNYIEHIKANIGKVDIIFVSSHDIVREALRENNIEYTLVYPNAKLKDEFIYRYILRGNTVSFIDFISDNWDNFIDEIKKETFPTLLELQKDEYISNYI